MKKKKLSKDEILFYTDIIGAYQNTIDLLEAAQAKTKKGSYLYLQQVLSIVEAHVRKLKFMEAYCLDLGLI